MIHYTPEAMETVRAAAVEGLYKLGRGGLEVGGVLFGHQTGDGVEILSSRPLVIEHAYGPTFALSEADRVALSKILQLPGIDPDLRGLAPVGWYHSHTRSGLSLTEQDLEIHTRYFPDAWQVALLLRPEKTASSRALFFARGGSGSLAPESLILLEAPPRQRKAVAVPAPAAKGIESEAAPAPVVPVRTDDPAAPAPVVPPRTAEPAELWIPPSLEPPPQVRRLNPWPWLLFAVALGVAVISTGFAFRGYWLPEVPAPLQLRLYDLDGQLSIAWDRSSRPVLEAQQGTLEITDGEKQSLLQLSGDQLRKGNVVHIRQSGTVAVRLVLLLDNSRQTEGMANFVGKPPLLTPAAVAAQETEQLKVELELLQAEFDKQNKRNRELEAANAVLRKRVSDTKK